MLVTYFRSSSYNSYDMCQMSYFITYNLGHQGESGLKATLGTIAHKVFEVLAACKQNIQNYPKSKKRLIIDDALKEISFDEIKLYSDDFVISILDKSFDYYTSKSKHIFEQADYKFCLKSVNNCLNYNNGQFDPRNRNILAPESNFDIVIDEPWAKYSYTLADGSKLEGNLAIKGTIDLVTAVNENTIEVVDYKTGKRMNWATGEEKTYDKLMKDPQLLLYYYAVGKLFPQYTSKIMSIFFLNDGGPFSLCYEDEHEELFLGLLRERFEAVKNNTSPALLHPTRRDFRCTKLCSFYKNSFPNSTNCMCWDVEKSIKREGMESTILKYSKPGFALGNYHAPGT